MRRLVVLLVACLAASAAMAQVNALPSVPHLLVKGHAEGHYVPDRFTIKLRVDAVDMVPGQACAKVESNLQQVLAQLEHAGAIRKLTVASSLSIQPKTEYRNDRQVFLGTEVTRDVEATFDDLDKLRGFIGQLSAGEEVQVTGTNVYRSDIEAIRDKLRAAAIASSQESARRIAKAYGLGIAGVYSVSEVAPNFSYGIAAASSGNELSDITVAAANAPGINQQGPPDIDLRVGTMEVDQDIYAVYLTKPE